jgi:Fe-S cluster assembly iron-binding protein IscA
MLRFTTQAIDHLQQVRGKRGLDASQLPRFVRRSGRLALTFARSPEEGDRLVDGGRMSTLVASSAADLLDNKTIDVKADEGKSVLVVKHRREPAATKRGRAQVASPTGA